MPNKEDEFNEKEMSEDMPEEEMGGEEELEEPTATEFTLDIKDYPGIENVAVGDVLSVVSNDGTSIVLTLGGGEESMPEEVGEGGQAIADELQAR